jgi:very-short-patch-repair endonuclease
MRDGYKREFARHLRRVMTDAERRLWYQLRNRTLMRCKFRRQHPVGPYIADFACIEARLIVELDGGQHLDSNHDRDRARFLQSKGYRVLRFWNNEVLTKTDAVLAAIHDVLAASAVPQSAPPPAFGNGNWHVEK